MEQNTQKIIQTRFGECDFDEEKVLHFPHGIIGFTTSNRFMLIALEEGSPFMLLQSLDETALGLLVVNPYLFTENYIVKVSDAEQSILEAKNVEDLSVLATVSVPKDTPERAQVNLTGPILINLQARLGMQIPQIDSENQPFIPLQLQKKEQEAEGEGE